jgi:diguanylate cyclase (GGDEF)-like protein
MNDVIRTQMEQCLETGLRSSYLLRFPAELEARFEQDQAEQRHGEQRRVGILGILLLDVFICSNYILDPASVWRGIVFRLFVFTPWSLFVIFLNWRGMLREHQEALSLSTIVVAGSCVLLAAPLGGAGESSAAVFAVIVVLFFGTLTLALRFPYALAAAVILMVEGFGYMELTRLMSSGETLTTTLLAGSSAILALVSNYKAERNVRMSYLLYLREAYYGKSLAVQNRNLAELSNADGLTGLANRRHFDSYFQTVWEHSQRERFVVSLLMVDIDHFKRLNDTFGHPFGDHVLVMMGDILRANTRAAEDMAARYGGEEFVILLPRQDSDQAQQIAERICHQARTTPMVTMGGENTVYVTLSCGIATSCPDEDESLEAMIARADASLYAAKRAGRDRICLAS